MLILVTWVALLEKLTYMLARYDFIFHVSLHGIENQFSRYSKQLLPWATNIQGVAKSVNRVKFLQILWISPIKTGFAAVKAVVSTIVTNFDVAKMFELP